MTVAKQIHWCNKSHGWAPSAVEPPRPCGSSAFGEEAEPKPAKHSANPQLDLLFVCVNRDGRAGQKLHVSLETCKIQPTPHSQKAEKPKRLQRIIKLLIVSQGDNYSSCRSCPEGSATCEYKMVRSKNKMLTFTLARRTTTIMTYTHVCMLLLKEATLMD